MTLPRFSNPFLAMAAACAIIALSFGAGWITRGWREAKTELKATQAQARVDAQEIARRQSIGVQYETQREAIHDFYEGLPNWWPRLVARHPDLADVDIGADGLCEWNRWNAGPSADFTCVASEGEDTASAGPQRRIARPDGKP